MRMYDVCCVRSRVSACVGVVLHDVMLNVVCVRLCARYCVCVCAWCE